MRALSESGANVGVQFGDFGQKKKIGQPRVRYGPCDFVLVGVFVAWAIIAVEACRLHPVSLNITLFLSENNVL